MAMYDIIGVFSDGQTDFGGATATETILSEDILNLGDSDLNWGNAELWLNIQVGTAFTSGGTPSTTITMNSSTDTTVNASDTAVITVAAQDLTALSSGDYVFRGRLPVAVDVEQYLGIVFVNTAAAYTAGSFDIWIDHGSQSDFSTQKALSNIT
ncbi:MAG: hypothetical protein KAS32_10750 [Candidatus Peribacteraceae bacterium]|nr:hypothetical protein [Candidatus Peribacteraceae bacterium]